MIKIGAETLQKWINEIKNKTNPAIMPDIEIRTQDNHSFVEIVVEEFPIKPVSFKGRYYKRIENSNHQLSISEIAEMHLKTFNNSWDKYPSSDHKIESISLEKVNSFIDKCNKFKEINISDDPLTVLHKFELVKGKMTFSKRQLK